MDSAKERLIVALDFATSAEAVQCVKKLRGKVGMFKVGSQLFTAAGPPLIRKLVELGAKVFLDLKFHDIPSIVGKAAVEASQLGVSMLTVHALGGANMLSHTTRMVAEASKSKRHPKPLVIGVTVLTSLTEQALDEIGMGTGVLNTVLRLASLAASSGLDGIVASGKEARALKHYGTTQHLKIVSPGIRPAWAPTEDQARVMTPQEALSNGADYLVVGRPIIRAHDPVEAIERILAEMEQAL